MLGFTPTYVVSSTVLHADAAGTGTDELGRQLEQRVQEFTLSNGLHFLVLERHNAPIVSCHTYANVGAFDEEAGQTGGPSPMHPGWLDLIARLRVSHVSLSCASLPVLAFLWRQITQH